MTTIVKFIAMHRQSSLTSGQSTNKESEKMKRSTLVSSVTACFWLGLAVPLIAAEPPATSTVNHLSPTEENVSGPAPAETCLNDLRSFGSQMQKDGYWLGGEGYGYGYPLGGYGYEYGLGSSPAEDSAGGYVDARPGYEIRMLFASADILARHGQQQPCEDLLATTRDIYKLYVADMNQRGMPMADVRGWRQEQIAAAQPVAGKNTSVRSDELLGVDVRNAQDEALGSVDDLVMSPQTGKIAYLVIARGGIFGIGKKYVPVPWEAFRVTPNVNLLVLYATKAAMDAAPQVNYAEFKTSGQQSQKVDTYWKAFLLNKGNN
jgi:sporulation protein YlmC with PRC-barrel domain